MENFLNTSLFFGAFLSLIVFEISLFLSKKIKLTIFNPLLVTMILIILFLKIFNIPYETYNKSSKVINYFLTPATVCLAVPLYEKFNLLKKNAFAICFGVISGVLSSFITIFLLSLFFKFNHVQYASTFPKSITTAIAVDIAKEFGGFPQATVALIIITGMFGNIFASSILKLARVKHPIAKGIGIGTSSHVMGTAKAIELGEIEGAMSSLSIALAGIFTVIFAGFFGNLI